MAVDLSGPRNAPPPSTGTTRTPGTRTGNPGRIARERTEARRDGLIGMGQLICVPLMLTNNLADVGAISQHWPPVAEEAAKLADTNEYVAKAVDFLTAVGPFAGLLTAVIPLAMQILVNHNRVPMHPVLGQLGVVSPDTMKAQAQADAMRQAAEAMRAQREAEAELYQLQREMEKEYANASVSPEVVPE